MPTYRYKAWSSAEDRQESGTIEAQDHPSAAAELRRRGYHPEKLEQISEPQLLRTCPACGQENDRERVRCTRCLAVLRGRFIEPSEAVEQSVEPGHRREITPGYEARVEGDGTLVVSPVGWSVWQERVGCVIGLIILGLFLFAAAEALPDGLRAALYLLATILALTLAVMTLFTRTEWHLGRNQLCEIRHLFGKRSTQRFVDAAIIVERETTHVEQARRLSYVVYVEHPQDRHVLRRLSGSAGDEQARTLGRFLAEQTGWPLDDRLGQWNVA